MIPIVAIVGRPNVGKSTLFNRLAGTQTAIVHDEPGVTRDRHYADVHIFSRTFTLIDTGGFDPSDTDAIGRGIARHVRAAIDEADVVICVLDGLGPPTEADAAAIRLLRQADKPVIYLANRLDNERLAREATELYALGVVPIAISALHGRGMAEFGEALLAALPPVDAAEATEADVVPRLALIGRPNAGKSSLLNRLSGAERSLVDDRPGTTRDPVDARVDYKGDAYVVVDTAGIRRRSKVEAGIESASVMQSLRSIARADVVAILVDAAEGLADQDAKLLGLVCDRARPIVVGLNKMDLLDPSQRKRALEEAKSQLHFAPWAPIVPFSNKTGEGIGQLMKAVRQAFTEYSQRVPTSQLNTFLQAIVEQKPPPSSGPRPPRLFFMTQAQASPPVFVVMCSNADTIKDAYRRFLANQIRQTFGFNSVPLVIRYKNRRRDE